ncbi:MAG TPA: hypothetical protein VL053_19235 [Arachidicoccus sp.]|nr:hypothetical protein [Arachidicoccus sp.]
MINLRNQKIDLSHVNSLEDIDQEIRVVKRRIRARESELKEDFKAIPKEAVRASLGSITPFFKKAKVADKAFTTIQTIIGGLVAAIIEGKRSGGGFKKGFATVLRQLSFLGTAKAVMQFFAKKKNSASTESSSAERPNSTKVNTSAGL